MKKHEKIARKVVKERDKHTKDQEFDRRKGWLQGWKEVKDRREEEDEKIKPDRKNGETAKEVLTVREKPWYNRLKRLTT